MVKAQAWLDQNHPHEQRAQTTQIRIIASLEGALDLTEFPNLQVLTIFGVHDADLKLSNCPQLEIIELEHCRNINLTCLANLPNKAKLRRLALPRCNLIKGKIASKIFRAIPSWESKANS